MSGVLSRVRDDLEEVAQGARRTASAIAGAVVRPIALAAAVALVAVGSLPTAALGQSATQPRTTEVTPGVVTQGLTDVQCRIGDVPKSVEL